MKVLEPLHVFLREWFDPCGFDPNHLTRLCDDKVPSMVVSRDACFCTDRTDEKNEQVKQERNKTLRTFQSHVLVAKPSGLFGSGAAFA